MYVANVLTIWSEALKGLFPADDPEETLRNLSVSTDYPMKQVEYPGLWINFTPVGDLRNVGIGHVERVVGSDEDHFKEVYRWHFGGMIEITVGAMTNLERALLIDTITKRFAVARIDENLYGNFRKKVEVNDLVPMGVSWETHTLSGFAESQGTPWETDDVIYEGTISMDLEGECVIDPEVGDLVPLSQIVVLPVEPGDPQPAGTWI